MHPALLFSPGGRLSVSELCAARLDGHLVELGEVFVPADLVEEAHTRAAAIASLIPPNTAASGPTAAWIHGAGTAPPGRHHVRRAVTHRIRPALSHRVVLHDTAVPSDQLQRLGGIEVMTPLRAMLDLALTLHRDPTMLHWIHLLAAVDDDLLADAAMILDGMGRMPGKRVGRAALGRAAVRRT